MTSSAPRASTYQLPLPEETIKAFGDVVMFTRQGEYYDTVDDTYEAMRAIAGPVVAAVLRQRAATIEHDVEVGPELGFDDHDWNVVRDETKMSEAFALRALADEIDGGA